MIVLTCCCAHAKCLSRVHHASARAGCLPRTRGSMCGDGGRKAASGGDAAVCGRVAGGRPRVHPVIEHAAPINPL